MKTIAIGLMSGTSADGIDAAAVEIEETATSALPRVKLLAFESIEYPQAVRSKIFELFDTKNATADKVSYMNFLLGELYADAAKAVIEKAGLSACDVSVIGSHGQTVFHSPDITAADGFPVRHTLQIGEGAVIAARTGIDCVSDFRTADIAVGGQGAPLVPFTECILYGCDKNIMLQNIGGIGNVTVLPANSAHDSVFAFDTGPGNVLCDAVVSSATYGKKSFDKDGETALSGTVSQLLFAQLKSDKYYYLQPPKSTGRELFGAEYAQRIIRFSRVNGISYRDVLATLAHLTAWSIVHSYENYILPHVRCAEIIVGGGGSHNKAMLKSLKELFAPFGVAVSTQDELGYSSDAKEAVAFALLAYYTINKKTNNLPSATGAQRSNILGKISFAVR